MTGPKDADWSRLAETAIEPNPFFTPVLASAAMTSLGNGRIRLATATSADGTLIALAPVRPIRLGRLVPALSVWTHLYGPLGTPLIDAADPAAGVAALVAAMEGERLGEKLLVFPDLPLDGPIAAALTALAQTSGRPFEILGAHKRAAILRKEGPAAPIRFGLSAKKRREYSRQLRRLAEQGALTIEGSEAAAGIEEFLTLEAKGWKGQRGTALARRPEAAAFARDVAKRAAPGEARILAIRVDGVAVATLVVFRSGDLAVTWKIAHDEAFARVSPGVQVMIEACDALMADPSLQTLDSLASADHPMVDRLMGDRIAIGTLVIGPRGGGAAYRLGLGLARTEAEAKARLKALLRRKASPPPAG